MKLFNESIDIFGILLIECIALASKKKLARNKRKKYSEVN